MFGLKLTYVRLRRNIHASQDVHFLIDGRKLGNVRRLAFYELPLLGGGVAPEKCAVVGIPTQHPGQKCATIPLLHFGHYGTTPVHTWALPNGIEVLLDLNPIPRLIVALEESSFCA